MAMPDMGKMIGPLPLGAWAAVLIGGLGVAYYTRHSGSATPAPTDAPVVNDPVGTGGSGMWANIDTPSSVDTVADPTTNDEWATKAIRTLVATGYPAINADQAIRRYVAGETLAASEAAMVNAAIMLIGPTPQVLPPPTTGIPTSPPPAPKPASGTYGYHTVLITENFVTICVKEKITPAALWQGNSTEFIRLDGSRGILTSYALHHGQRLVIPKGKPYNKGYAK